MNLPGGRVGAVIAAAGSSQRMAGQDKIFIDLGGRPLLAWAVDILESCAAVQQTVLVLAGESVQTGLRLTRESGWRKVSDVCAGGGRRQDSVLEGLRRLKGCDWVVIHDGARPCLTVDLIERGLEEATKTGAAIAAVPVSDTIKAVLPDARVERTLQREMLWAVQTPQVFRFDVVWTAYRQATVVATDDASLVEMSGVPVRVYMGSRQNIKVTTPEDVILAEAILKNRGRF
ncbi:MAG: 2-C-methyl-D-erythritol 4-phosphate cytidylyltransferase [Dehalococcoidia bacterium]|nr:2-C-methyl-D-erythritol 4-phosphate cytidylyltransferase [Dehalococcoidia bacterium]